MKLSVIILNYRSKELTDTCLQKIFGNPINCPFEVIVVDNASNDDSPEYLENKWGGKIQFIQAPGNLGFAGGNNLGIKQAQGEYVLIMNPDIEVRKDTINDLIHYLNSNESCGIVGPQLIYPDGTIQDSYRKFPTLVDLIIKRTFLRKIFKQRMIEYLMYNRHPEETHQVDWLVGACILIRKNVLIDVEFFDERFFLFLEDTDLCRKFHKKKFGITYFPKSKALHNHKRLSGGHFFDSIFKKTFYIHVISALKYTKKWSQKRNTTKSSLTTNY